MNHRMQKATEAVALFLVFSITQVYVLANSDGPDIATEKAATKTERTDLLFGRVEMDAKKSMMVNGNPVVSGATVFSGAQLFTPEAVGASIQLESLGRLEIMPNTNLTLTFDKTSVDVVVTKGDVFLSTNEGVKGTVITPEGKAEPASSVQATGTTGQAGGGQAGGQAGGAGGGIGTGWVVIGAAAVGGAVIAAVVVPCRRGRNPSPGTPRRGGDCDRGF